MKPEKVFKTSMIFLFVVFVAIYVSSKSGYYDFTNHNKTVLTKEAMEKFESDVASGVDIDIENYMKTTQQDYSNNISDTALSISTNI